MNEKSTVEEERKKVLDDTCFRLFRLMLSQSKGIRYNQLHRLLCQYFPISKPAFNDHLKHLIQKKIVLRKEITKQNVHFLLNNNHLAVKKSRESVKEIKEDIKRLSVLLEKKEYRKQLPELIARTAAINFLNLMKLSVSVYFLPRKVAWKKSVEFESMIVSQAVLSQEIQFLNMMITAILKKNKTNTLEKIQNVTEVLNDAVKYEKKQIDQIVAQIAESISVEEETVK